MATIAGPRRLCRTAAAVLIAVLCQGCVDLAMPGKSFSGPLPVMTDQEQRLRDALKADVEKLARAIGDRHFRAPAGLAEAADYIASRLTSMGYKVTRQAYEVDGVSGSNLEAQLAGTKRPDEIVIVGAHYDTVPGAPGANDNASGVAAVLAMAQAFAGAKTDRTIRFVTFVNEEPPNFSTARMGSMVYAKACRQRQDSIVAMVQLDSLGYYTDEPRTQRFGFPLGMLFPDTGNFVMFVSNWGSRDIVRQAVASFRRTTAFPSEGASAASWLAPSMALSDHWSFWRYGYPAILITDTDMLRYPYHHSPQDTPDKLDYDRFARVVGGLKSVVADLAGGAGNGSSGTRPPGDGKPGT
ncbi:MAG: M28 family peptidase [Phycisphaerae bacterium]